MTLPLPHTSNAGAGPEKESEAACGYAASATKIHLRKKEEENRKVAFLSRPGSSPPMHHHHHHHHRLLYAVSSSPPLTSLLSYPSCVPPPTPRTSILMSPRRGSLWRGPATGAASRINRLDSH